MSTSCWGRIAWKLANFDELLHFEKLPSSPSTTQLLPPPPTAHGNGGEGHDSVVCLFLET